ncbi:PREDICTED: protein UPSTREAM OF FLC-like [Camelina sativa]|uniref:Protein UPSTREAM OF FLC-like n=1 Tax=Camelina sativa TaxID=90675 RepID=A0ABM0XBT6_CAMSA|nr:PREDICTED: protein UPSTREAM OF FLC-like [Camelina sativa]
MSSRVFRGTTTTENNYLVPRRSKDQQQDTSPDRNRIWSEPRHKPIVNRKVPVVYYLCRNGQLDHPHFMEVTLSSHDGLYLKDVINRLNDLRGKGMASLYSWSSKRSYKNGFVWHDLSEDDFIFPVQGQEYVLKGSEVLDSCLISNPRSLLETTSFRDPRSLNPDKNSGDDIPAVINRRRNQSWSSIDLSEYKVYKATESSAESTQRLAADASTQTDDRRRRRKPAKEEVEEEDEEVKRSLSYENQSTELSRDEISPPPSDSSPETLENLIKADGRLILRPNESSTDHRAVESLSSGRMRASAVLMQLISCGTMSFKECGPVLLKDQGLSMTGRSGCTLAREAGDNNSSSVERVEKELKSFGRVQLEDKEYFSGSLIETKKDELVPTLKRSSSYNADRSSRMVPTTEKDEEAAVRAKCIPRKPKSVAVRNNGGQQ